MSTERTLDPVTDWLPGWVPLGRSVVPQFVLFLFVSLTLAVITVRQVWPHPFVGLYWDGAGRVTETAPTLAMEPTRADVGDRIIAIDGVAVQEVDGLPRTPIGETIGLTWQRGDTVYSSRVMVLPYRPVDRFWQFEPLVVGLVISLLGVLVLALRPKVFTIQLFFRITQVSAGVLYAGLLSAYGYALGSLLFNVLLAWLAPLLIHFHSQFPRLQNTRRHRLLLSTFYPAALGLSVLYGLAFYSSLSSLVPLSTIGVGIRVLVLAAFVGSILLMIDNYRHAASQVERRQVRLIVLSYAALFPLIGFSLVPDLLGVPKLLDYQWSFLFLLAIPVAYSVAVWRHNLFDTDRILNRSIVFAILAFFWAGTYLLLTLSLNRLLRGDTSLSPLIGTLVIVVMALTMPALQRRLQTIVDSLMYSGWYNTSQLQAHWSRALSTTQEWGYLGDLFIEKLPRVLNARGALLYRADEAGTLTLWRRAGMAGQSAPPIPPSSQLVYRLRQLARPLLHTELRETLSLHRLDPAEARLVERDDIGVWVPFIYRDRLELLLLLSHKRADAEYSGDDLHLLSVLAPHAATSVQNIRLVEALRQQLEVTELQKQEVVQAHHALVEAREEERKSLAREVHDGPLQDIIGVSYQLGHFSRQSASPETAHALQSLRQETIQILDRLRRICADLRPPDLDILGLAAAISSHVDSHPELKELVELDLGNGHHPLPSNEATALFRIYQEAVQNTLKHARASRIWVTIEQDSTHYALEIRDNGRGFEVPARVESFSHARHFGLVGIKERAASMNANLTISSERDTGTTIRVVLALPRPEERQGGP